MRSKITCQQLFLLSENLLVKSERSQFYGKEKCKKYEGLWTERL